MGIFALLDHLVSFNPKMWAVNPLLWDLGPPAENVNFAEQRFNMWKKQFLQQDDFLKAQNKLNRRRLRIGSYIVIGAELLFLMEATLAYFSSWSI